MVGIGTLVLPVLFSQDSVLRVTRPYPPTDEPLRLAVGHRYGRIVSLELGTCRLCPEVAERQPAGLIRGLDTELEVRSQVHAPKIYSGPGKGKPKCRPVPVGTSACQLYGLSLPYNLCGPVSLVEGWS